MILELNGTEVIASANLDGIEYNFDFPLSLSLDWRPIFGPRFGSGNIGFYDGGLYYGAIAWGIRYRF